MELKEKIIIDTNVFVNPDSRKYFGKTPTAAFKNFLKKTGDYPHLGLYVPVSIFEEMKNFIHMDKVPKGMLKAVTSKEPNWKKLSMPAVLLYRLTDEFQTRVNKGLRRTERALKEAQEGLALKDTLAKLKQDHNTLLRENFIDSGEDVELLFLTKQLEGILITTDKGIIKWSEILGIRYLEPSDFLTYLESL